MNDETIKTLAWAAVIIVGLVVGLVYSVVKVLITGRPSIFERTGALPVARDVDERQESVIPEFERATQKYSPSGAERQMFKGVSRG